ncbi:MAG: HypC/HybG/HupF family hydrogenase formation chaperone [Syntrophaceae bacterium]|jgi:hydrogenase expression/formation protein HypC|nr:HypC/HybG/HupF family hydrogenase formation chaperone [Syntrophaceae bacterium]
MCLAIPSEIVAIKDNMATIDLGGVRREVSLLLLPEEASVGEYVLVHAGFAIQKIDKEAAEETLKLFEEIAEKQDA